MTGLLGVAHCGHPLLHLFGRDVLDVRPDVPLVPERVLDSAHAVAIELVLDGPLQFRSVDASNRRPVLIPDFADELRALGRGKK